MSTSGHQPPPTAPPMTPPTSKGPKTRLLVVVISVAAVVVAAVLVLGGIFAWRAWEALRGGVASLPDGVVYVHYTTTAPDGGEVPEERREIIANALSVRLLALGAENVTTLVVADGFVLAVPPQHRQALAKLGTKVPTAQFHPVREVVPGACRGGKPTAADIVCALQDRDGAGYRLGPAALGAADVDDATAEPARTGDGYIVQATLTRQGSRAFGELTQRLASAAPPKNRLAIVVGGAVVSAPTIIEPIPGRQVQVTGDFTQREAHRLAQAMLARPTMVTLHRGAPTTR